MWSKTTASKSFFARLAPLLKDGARFYLSEIHETRASYGKFANFMDPKTGETTRLHGRMHVSTDIARAAQRACFMVDTQHDVRGSAALAELNPDWKTYLDQCLLQQWIFEKTDRPQSQ